MRIERGQRGQGKALAGAIEELSALPEVSVAEVQEFCRVQIKRCGVNLANAKSRGDKRAVAHLERKLGIYQHLQDLLLQQVDPPVGARECPECRTHSVNSFGYCACCGKTF